jgi:hypothetical protein
MIDEKAPLADTEVAAGDELTLEDIARLHESPMDSDGSSSLFTSNFDDDQESTLELSQDLQGDNNNDLDLAIEHQRIQIPTTVNMTTKTPEATPAPEIAQETTVSTSVPHQAQANLLLKMGNETYDLSKKDDIAWLEQQFQALFSQCLYPYLQRMSRIWNSEEEVGAMYHRLEELSRTRGPVEEIMDVAQQVSVYREMTEKEQLNSDEILQALSRLETLQDILKRYQNLFEGLI